MLAMPEGFRMPEVYLGQPGAGVALSRLHGGNGTAAAHAPKTTEPRSGSVGTLVRNAERAAVAARPISLRDRHPLIADFKALTID